MPLKALGKEQQQLLQWALKGFPEQTVVSENKRSTSSERANWRPEQKK